MSTRTSGSYTLNTKIYETASARILRGYRDTDGIPVVIKSLRAEHPSAMDLMRLRHEYALLDSLNLPGVVRPLELRQVGYGLELVLEDAGEMSLHTLIQSGRLDLRRALEFAVSLTKVVASIHREGIVHKDLKPHHFLMREENPESIILVDFGLATRLSRYTQVATAPSQLEGSLPYLAPEQTGRMNRVVDRRSDLYSLGVVLYELFVRCLPFQAADAAEMIHSHIARKPRPPAEVIPSIPEVLSDIIVRLLSKVPEDRYQSAAGVQADLERCLCELSPTGRVRPFALGERDVPNELSVPQKMYGRQDEIRAVAESYERVRQGAAELLLLSGYSGIGKSALAAELYRYVGEGGHYVGTKFEPLLRGVPYAPIVDICRQLVHSVLIEPSDVLSRLADSLLAALGPNGKLILDLVPALEAVIGKQPDVPELGPTESRARLELVLQRFLMAFASAEHPLVLFLDDLQWADAASVRLIEVLLTASERRHLLVVGAYRNNEVDSVHPLTIAIERLRKDGVATTELSLGPLGVGEVAELLAETFRSNPEEVMPLADVLFAKTQGNPFFLLQMLATLYRDGLICFNDRRHAWEWELERIRGALVTDNVVEFMVTHLRKLSGEAQEVLRIAACIGHRFDGDTLAVVSQKSVGELRASLWEALQHGLIVPLDDKYRYAAESSNDDVAVPNVGYRFSHDRVRQAAAALIGDTDQARVHLDIGRLLLARAGADLKADDLFTVVDHFNQGLHLATEAERERLAQLNLAAGERAREAAAPAAGVHYLATAIGLFGEGQWEIRYESAFRAHFRQAECEYLVGNLKEAFRLLDAIEQHATELPDRCQARNLRMILFSKIGQMQAACALTVDTARLLGMNLPPPEDKAALQAATGAEFGALQAKLAERSVESLADLPPMVDPKPLILLRTLVRGYAPAFTSNQELFALLVVKSAMLTLTHGTTTITPFVFAQYGLVHLLATGDSKTAYRFGKLAIELSSRKEHAAAAGPTHFIVGGFIAHWREHPSVTDDYLRTGLRLSLESGDLQYATFCATISLFQRVFLGVNLVDIEQAIPAVVALTQRTGDVVNLAFLELLRKLIAAMDGRNQPWGSLFDAEFDREKLESLPYVVKTFAALAIATVSYLSGSHREAVEAADAFSPLPANGLQGDHTLLRALALAQLARTAAPVERESHLVRIRGAAKTLAGWAEGSPANHGARDALLRAELAELEGRLSEAMDLYERAIELAHEHNLIPQEALANELCGAFHLEHGRARAARGYLMEAYYCYQRWGVNGKLRELRERHPYWFSEDGAHPLGSPGTTTTAIADSGGSLDLATAIRASQTIVSELALERVVKHLMQALVENAGAQRGFLLLLRGEVLRIEATISVEPDAVTVGLAQELAETSELAVTVVRYVARAKEPLVLCDAARDHRFASDPYVARCQPKSILCLPMAHQGSLVGVLYLENNLATAAFSPARTELLQLLAAQAAAAVENSRLYDELATTTGKLREANETLESQVAARTEELQRVLGELWSEMDLARKIQTVLLPKEPRLKSHDVAAEMVPAAEVGGDYYDVVPGEAADWVLIGDVSGHGVTAGLVMMMVQSAVRAVLEAIDDPSPATVLGHVNTSMWRNFGQIGGNEYMTMTALKLEGNRVTHAGQHQDILVYRASSRRVEQIETVGTWIGLVPNLATMLENSTFELEPGDTMLLYSDGLPERLMVGGRRLDVDGLAQMFKDAVERSSDPHAIVKSIIGVLGGKTLEDDVTIMAVRYTPRELF